MNSSSLVASAVASPSPRSTTANHPPTQRFKDRRHHPSHISAVRPVAAIPMLIVAERLNKSLASQTNVIGCHSSRPPRQQFRIGGAQSEILAVRFSNSYRWPGAPLLGPRGSGHQVVARPAPPGAARPHPDRWPTGPLHKCLVVGPAGGGAAQTAGTPPGFSHKRRRPKIPTRIKRHNCQMSGRGRGANVACRIT